MGRGGPELRVDAQLIAALPKREARPTARPNGQLAPMGENDGQTNPERLLLGGISVGVGLVKMMFCDV